MCTHTFTHTFTYIYICICKYTCTYMHMYICMVTCIHARVYVYRSISMHRYTWISGLSRVEITAPLLKPGDKGWFLEVGTLIHFGAVHFHSQIVPVRDMSQSYVCCSMLQCVAVCCSVMHVLNRLALLKDLTKRKWKD